MSTRSPEDSDRRYGFVGIITTDRARQGARINQILSTYADCIVGRLGLPDLEGGALSIVTLIVHATTDRLGAMDGKARGASRSIGEIGSPQTAGHGRMMVLSDSHTHAAGAVYRLSPYQVSAPSGAGGGDRKGSRPPSATPNSGFSNRQLVRRWWRRRVNCGEPMDRVAADAVPLDAFPGRRRYVDQYGGERMDRGAGERNGSDRERRSTRTPTPIGINRRTTSCQRRCACSCTTGFRTWSERLRGTAGASPIG